MRILGPDDPIDWNKVRWEFTPEELKEAYALARATFTADDLQKFFELDEGVPADEVLAELEAAQRHFDTASS
jgi:hypothetical protein